MKKKLVLEVEIHYENITDPDMEKIIQDALERIRGWDNVRFASYKVKEID